MKLNKTLMACIFLLAIATIGAASASENITSDAAAVEPTDITLQSVDEDSSAQAADENEIVGGDYDNMNEHLRATIYNVTAYDNDKAVVHLHAECTAHSGYNGIINIYVNKEFKNSTKVENCRFVNSKAGVNTVDRIFTLDDLGISSYENDIGISVIFIDTDKNRDVNLANDKVTLSYLDLDCKNDDDINTAEATYHLANDFSGTLSASLNGIDLGSISCDGWLDGHQFGTIADPSIFRLKDNVFIVSADDAVKGHEEKKLIFNLTPSIIYSNEFYSLGLSNPHQFFSTGEEFNIGIRVPEEITGTLKVYEGIYSYDTMKFSKGAYLATADIANGTSIATVSLKNAGDQFLYLEYDTNKGKGFVDDSEEIIANSADIRVTVTPSEFIVGDSNVTVSFTSMEEGYLAVYLDRQGEEIYVENSTNYTIEYLDVGTHTIRVVFEGENKYSKCFTVNVKPWTPTYVKLETNIAASQITATYNAAQKLTVTLKDEFGHALSGEKITFKFASVTKTAKTNGQGKASVNVETLVPNTYAATVKFAGSESYKASSRSVKVVVKKAKPSITAAKKTFKANAKTKKVTATLKDNKGKVIKSASLTFTINKKTYSTKTNSKGVATFSIKLTKKGSYTGTVNFKTTKYYQALSKKVSVKIN